MAISLFYTSAPKIMIICYTVPEMWHVTHVIFIFHFGLFFALVPPNSAKNENFKNIKKWSEDIIILHKCTKNRDHRLYCSWDMARDGCNCCFSFWAIFCTLTPLTAQKNENFKKMKKRPRYIMISHLWSKNYD